MDFISSDNSLSLTCVVGGMHYGLKVVFCFMHVNPSHYQHLADLLTYIEHIRWKILEAYVLSRVCIKFNLVISVTFLYLFSQNVGCVELAHLSLDEREDISITSYNYQIGSINNPSHCCHIFPRLCLRWLYHHMLSVSNECIYPRKALECVYD